MVERSDDTDGTVEAEQTAGSSEADSDGAEQTAGSSEADSDGAEQTAGSSEADSDQADTNAASVDASDVADGLSESAGSRADRAAERFLELESELREAGQSPLPDGTIRRGQVRDANRIPAAEIPEEYPTSIDGGQALALTIDVVDGGEVQTYLDWPADGDPGGDSTLGRLLEALDVPPEQLASLYGKQVLVEVVDGDHTVYVPPEPPRGKPRETAVALALAGSLFAVLGMAVAGGVLFSAFLVAFAVLTFVALPYFTYRDAWYLRTHSDWTGGPWFWATLSLLPGLNLLSTVAYLARRRDVTFLASP